VLDIGSGWGSLALHLAQHHGVEVTGLTLSRRQLEAAQRAAAERGLADAQWMLGSLYLRGAPELPRDTARAEALLRRAAERGNPGAAFQLGIVLLSGADAVTPNQREALLWITRSAARGQKEAQDLLEGLRPGAPVRSEPAGPVTR
jgi:TPR repeat protein